MTYLLCKNGNVSFYNDQGFEQFNLSKQDKEVLHFALSNYAFIVPKIKNSFSINMQDWIVLINDLYDCTRLQNKAVIDTLNKIK